MREALQEKLFMGLRNLEVQQYMVWQIPEVMAYMEQLGPPVGRDILSEEVDFMAQSHQ